MKKSVISKDYGYGLLSAILITLWGYSLQKIHEINIPIENANNYQSFIFVLFAVAPPLLLIAYTQMRSISEITSAKERIEELVLNTAKVNSGDHIYEILAEDIKNAKESIQLLTSVENDEFIPESTKRDKYYNALLKASEKDSISFTRIIQFEENNFDYWHDIISNQRRSYFRNEMFKMIKGDHIENNNSIRVMKSQLDISFTLIDEEKLFFNIFSNDKKRPTTLSFYVESKRKYMKPIITTMQTLIGESTQVKIDDIKKLKDTNPIKKNKGIKTITY